ncbi:MAG: hypothetical protein K2X46_19960 [Roseomonas sp.]|nr:hypothetical protein [Roseomonas sp.]
MNDGKPQSQSDRFAKAARAAGANEDEAAFRAKLTVIARQKPKGEAPEAPPEPPETKPAGKPKHG